MIPRPLSLSLALLLLPVAAAAQADKPFTAAEIEAADYGGGDLPPGRSALTAKVQILMDRSGTSPGVVDGFKGGMSESAMIAFERRAGLPMDGVLDQQVWDMLQLYAADPLTERYTITDEDAQGLVESIPTDYAEKAAMSHMGYTSIAEKLGERFHMDEKFIGFLNPGVVLEPGAVIEVTKPAPPIKGKVARIYVDKATRRVAAYDADGRMLADYPATVGSDNTPSPSGEIKVLGVALDPTYTYDPSKNFKQGENDKVLIVPPGPNAPVGNVWIDLDKPTYGIHGTPTPSQLFRNQSYGCVRLTNWDARELAHMVQPNVTVVEFLQPGVSIADATGVSAAPAPVTAAVEPTAAPAAAAAPTVEPAAGTATTSGTAPATVPDTPPAGAAAAEKAVEDTTEETADAEVTSDPAYVPADPLADALREALPEGALPPVLPPAPEQP